MTVKMKIEGARRLSQKLAKAQVRVKNPGNFLQVAGVAGYRDVIDHFEKTQGPKSLWKRLKYPRRKRAGQRRGISDKPLQDTGLLRNSVRWRPIRNAVVFFSNLVYAATHQHGNRKHNVPARPFLWLGKNLVADLSRRYAKYVTKEFG